MEHFVLGYGCVINELLKERLSQKLGQIADVYFFSIVDILDNFLHFKMCARKCVPDKMDVSGYDYTTKTS